MQIKEKKAAIWFVISVERMEEAARSQLPNRADHLLVGPRSNSRSQEASSSVGSYGPVKSDRLQLSRRSYYSPAQPLMVRRLNMNPLRYTFLQLRLWAFELKLWMDGRRWDEVRFIVAERLRDLARATHERI